MSISLSSRILLDYEEYEFVLVFSVYLYHEYNYRNGKKSYLCKLILIDH